MRRLFVLFVVCFMMLVFSFIFVYICIFVYIVKCCVTIGIELVEWFDFMEDVYGGSCGCWSWFEWNIYGL